MLTDSKISIIEESFVSWEDIFDEMVAGGLGPLSKTIEDVYYLIDAICIKDYFLKNEDYRKCSIIQNWINSNLHVLEWIINNPDKIWKHFYDLCDDDWTSDCQHQQLEFFKSNLNRAQCSHTETVERTQIKEHPFLDENFIENITDCALCGCNLNNVTARLFCS